MSTLAEIPVLSRLVRVLANAPSPQEIMDIRTTEEEEDRLRVLKEKLHSSGLSEEEEHEVQFYLFAEHIVKMAKIEAYQRLRA